MGLRAALFFFPREVAKRESQLMPWTHLPANILSTHPIPGRKRAIESRYWHFIAALHSQ